MTADELRKWIFGIEKRGPTLAEILATWGRSDQEGLPWQWKSSGATTRSSVRVVC